MFYQFSQKLNWQMDLSFDIPHLSLLSSRIRQASNESLQAARTDDIVLEQLPYSLAAAAHAVSTVLTGQCALANKELAGIDSDHNSFGVFLLHEERNLISFAVDAYLDAARRAQNALVPYLSKILKCSLTASFSDVIKAAKKGNLKLPARIHSSLEAYWHYDGLKLKSYRDLTQHHAVASADLRVTIAPDKKPLFHLLLPNNPEVKNPGELKYDDPKVQAVLYVVNSYGKLCEFMFGITHLLLSYTSGEESEVKEIVSRNTLKLGVPHDHGHLVIEPSEIRQRLDQMRTTMGKRLDAELPRSDIVPTLFATTR